MGVFLFKKNVMVHNKFVKVKKGGNNMSPKETLYIEDTLAHTKFMKEKCTHAATQLTDANLKKLVEDAAQRNQKIFDDIYSLLVNHAKGGA
jgi:molybdenum-dependent DNA-binding transcriptional regulator ModE